MKNKALQAEKELEIYRKALDESAYVIETDPDGVITYVNDKYCELMKYSREELLGKNNRIFNSQYHTEEFYKELWDTIESGKNFRAEIRNKAKDGSLVWLDATIIPFMNNEGKPYKYLAIRYNVTTKINAMRTREQFLANISHDLKTPLHSIINFAGFMMETSLDETQTEYMNSIRNSSGILHGLIKDLLDIYKIESGKISFSKTGFYLHSIEKSMEDIFAARLKEKKLRMSFHFSSDTPEYINGDEFRLNQVLMNLISNSVQYTETGGINVKVSVAGKTDDLVVIRFEVADSGIGIPREMLPVIFSRFSQVGANKAGTSGHVGLGLSIVKQLVELQGGMLDIESTVGYGTSVVFEIPFEIASPPVKKDHGQPAIPLFPGKKILIADDSQMNRAILLKYLHDAGMETDSAENGEEALRKLEDGNFDLLLLDLQMPVMDGFETLERIRSGKSKNMKDLKVIVVSARFTGEEKQHILDAGATDILAKPFQSEELFVILAKYFTPAEYKIKETLQLENQDVEVRKIANLSLLATLTENNKELTAEMIAWFLDNSPVSMAEILKSLDEGDWKNARRLVHMMANQVNYMGIETAYVKLDAAELLAKEEKEKELLITMIHDVEGILKQAYIELKEELYQLNKEITPGR